MSARELAAAIEAHSWDGHLADWILDHWLPGALADERVVEAVVRAIYGDGLDQAHEIATAALTAAVTALTEEDERG